IPGCITSMNAPARSLELSSRLDRIYLIDSIDSKANFGCLSKIRMLARFAILNNTVYKYILR
ncbi:MULTISPECIES: hypothetical protein, partial [unclassified Halomonas]|uniref:hypothetical protein n=1 Tax=unclassified Halomonas TaxID=2609666 RepID=UPI0040332DF2